MSYKKDKIVIVKGIAGLGNRLRCVAAAMEYAASTGRSLYVDWKDGMFALEGENAFNQYFEIFNFPHVDDFSELILDTFYPSVYAKLPMDNSIYNYFEKEQIENRFVRKGMHYMFKILHALPVPDSAVCKMSMFYQAFVLTKEYQQKFNEKGKFAFGAHLDRGHNEDAVIYCDNVPFYKQVTLKRHVRLKSEIQERVDKFVSEQQLDKDTVGVHVRASGKKCYGDMQKFIRKLKAFNVEKGIKRVFLCTDNAEIEELFKKEFSDSLVMQPKFLPKIKEGETGIHDLARDSKDADLQKRLTDEAVIDMFALSKVTYLFYQFGSTFSEISAVYHDNKDKCQSWMSL